MEILTFPSTSYNIGKFTKEATVNVVHHFFTLFIGFKEIICPSVWMSIENVRVRISVKFRPSKLKYQWRHYSDVIMSEMASIITSVSRFYSTVCSGADQRKHQSSASLAFVMGIHQWPVNSPHKGPIKGKCVHLMTSSSQSASRPGNVKLVLSGLA